MFLPFEGLYAEVLRIEGLFEVFSSAFHLYRCYTDVYTDAYTDLVEKVKPGNNPVIINAITIKIK